MLEQHLSDAYIYDVAYRFQISPLLNVVDADLVIIESTGDTAEDVALVDEIRTTLKSCKILVFSSNTGKVQFMLRNGVDGFFFNSSSPEEFFATIDQIRSHLSGKYLRRGFLSGVGQNGSQLSGRKRRQKRA